MKLETQGIILFTERFDECVQLYRDTIGLPVWFEKLGLVCLHFGDGYLMIETGGVAQGERKSHQQNPTVIRFNVPHLEQAIQELASKGLNIDVQKFDWGTIGVFLDPDGNVCELITWDKDV